MYDVCYLDMDGVLVDFVGGALAVHGEELPAADVRWGFPGQIGFSGVNDPLFWEKMGFSFWSSLSWTREGQALLHGLERMFGENIVVMTSPCDTPGSVEGKVAWIKRELPAYRRRFFVGPPKHLAAGPGKLLVDDHDGNVDKFHAAGGNVVLVPRPWNRRAAESDKDGGFSVAQVLSDVRASLVGIPLTHPIDYSKAF